MAEHEARSVDDVIGKDGYARSALSSSLNQVGSDQRISSVTFRGAYRARTVHLHLHGIPTCALRNRGGVRGTLASYTIPSDKFYRTRFKRFQASRLGFSKSGCRLCPGTDHCQTKQDWRGRRPPLVIVPAVGINLPKYRLMKGPTGHVHASVPSIMHLRRQICAKQRILHRGQRFYVGSGHRSALHWDGSMDAGIHSLSTS
ncbi:hypothetical protein LXA43DRAFT_97979 [Ganoderma leucocontextum]|nr:hypothetical protein LXA43DRAFT_97979 [Ganoderma leucocontextum]